MKKMTHWLALASITTLCFGVGNLTAQEQPAPGAPGGPGRPGGERGNRGNVDPAQFQQRMTQGLRDRLEITDETEWKAVEPLVQKVTDLRREQMGGNMRGFGRGGRGGGAGGGAGGDTAVVNEQTALSDAVEKNASKDELKSKMTAFRKAKADKEAQLKTAQEALKKVLTTKQEAIALQMGLVN